MTLTFAEPQIQVEAVDFAVGTMTVRVVPGNGTALTSESYMPSRFVVEGGGTLGALNLVRTAPSDDEAMTKYSRDGLVTFLLPDEIQGASMFYRAAVR